MIGFGNPLLDGDQSHALDGAYFKAQAALARTHKGCAQSVAVLIGSEAEKRLGA